jgi:hypothetical protein
VPTPPPSSSPVQVAGRARSKSGSCPNVTFEVDRTTVVADAATTYSGGDCQHIQKRLVVVTGLTQPDGSVLALQIDFTRN